jgi:DNA-binding transcriptional LysR family regulator
MWVVENITLDQLDTFRVVAESGSFSEAARRMGRAQSAVSRAVALLERQLDVTLFDRSQYRPPLTPAGKVLLDDAREILDRLGHFAERAKRLDATLESEVTLVVDGVFPVERLVTLSRGFAKMFPSVGLRLLTENLGGVAARVRSGEAAIGVAGPHSAAAPGLRRRHIGRVRLVPVVRAGHPLAKKKGRISSARLARFVQVVLTDPSGGTRGVDVAVLSPRTFRVADFGTKLAFLLEGLGWGNMPEHWVSEPLSKGKLVRIQPEAWAPDEHTLSLSSVVSTDRVLGPAARWVWDTLAELCR